jgi:predicted nucleic acid-binding protein
MALGKPEAVFVDTGAFYAVINAGDDNHLDAVEIFQRAGRVRIPMVTSKWTVVETHALLLVRAGRHAALRWLDRVPALVLAVTPEDEHAALRILRSHRDKDYSLVDAASFAIMERTGVRHFHSYDRHFRQYGRFVAVAPAML